MQVLELFIELEYEDGGRSRRKLYFKSVADMQEYLKRYDDSTSVWVSDLEEQWLDSEECGIKPSDIMEMPKPVKELSIVNYNELESILVDLKLHSGEGYQILASRLEKVLEDLREE